MKRILVLSCVVLSLSGFQAVAQGNNAATAPQMTSNTQEQSTDAIQIILKDHAYIRQAFGQLKGKLDTNYDESQAMFKKLQDFLVKHETMEETAFYPELKKNKNLSGIIDDLIKQEQQAAKALKDIDSITDKTQWVAKVKEIAKAVDHHATEEETKLFPKVRKEVDQRTLNDIGAKMKDWRTKNNMEIK